MADRRQAISVSCRRELKRPVPEWKPISAPWPLRAQSLGLGLEAVSES